MSQQTQLVRAAAMSLSEAGEAGPVGYLAAMELVLTELFAVDLLLFNEIDAEHGRVRLTGSGYVPPEGFEQTLLSVADEHPVMVRYLTTPTDPSPLRMSDLIGQREFERTRTFREIFRPLEARFQMAILTGRGGLVDGRAWAFNRGVGDFSEAEVDMARRLRPSLVILDEMFRPRPAAVEPVPGEQIRLTTVSNGRLPVLTRRELEVVGLLSKGWTAGQIAHALRLSPRTIRKHLQHIYDKLGVHDRLVAVDRARTLGLVPE
jgi:DNA-binding CsgD family transcriptional regulator